ncbi:MAG TPA: malto-oligosyltrehalose trehalohydrolase [Candidatus Binatia bacterium]|nr:malto-oligosyltrehalose trehalohydrolase [Candidatus Binatia bacterium]
MATLGAVVLSGRTCRFRVWAPHRAPVHVHLLASNRLVPMHETERGYHETAIEGVASGERYVYQLGADKQRPDPASRFQPEGVHGPSQVIDGNFSWNDASWGGLPLKDYIVYELHVGTFAPTGTFKATIAYLEYLVQLGVSAIELMPVGQFPGSRNWGYDGVFPFAAQNSYGGPLGLKSLINACHQRGLAVILDVVYSHIGPEGNYLADFGPYFSDRYKTPWGPALNFDGPFSDEVKNYFIQNALYWVTEFHVDALRLDAVHAILDHAPATFLEDLSAEVHRAGERLKRHIFLIAESAGNNARLIRLREQGGGGGLDAQWNDDFHHCLRKLLTGEQLGYDKDQGEFAQLVKAYREGSADSDKHSRFHPRRYGCVSGDIPAGHFVVFAQNHDQVGNRMLGDRLSQSVSYEDLKLAAGLVILSPFIPLLFMGEEYGETAPFPYFTSHSDGELAEAVRRGRRDEFAAFGWHGEIPDPQNARTFLCAKLNHELRNAGEGLVLLKFYRELIRLRKKVIALIPVEQSNYVVAGVDNQRVIIASRCRGDDHALLIANLAAVQASVSLPVPSGHWRNVVDSADETWRGKGSLLPRDFRAEAESQFLLVPRSFALFVREKIA